MADKRKVKSEKAPAQSPRSASISPAIDASTTLDVDALRQIVEILEASEVTRLSWRRGEERLFIRRGPMGSDSGAQQFLGGSVAISAIPDPIPSTTRGPPRPHVNSAATAPAPVAAPSKPGN